jgi:hypothetical protein
MLEPDRSLPNEILVHIFSHLSQRNLTKVVLVSHRFNAVAERVLYSSIDIDEDRLLIRNRDVPQRTLGWCDAMKRNQLYHVPRKLSIRWRIYIPGLEMSKALSHSCSLVSDNIRRLTLLDTLELSMGPCDLTYVTVDLLIRDLRLPNLRHCLLSAGHPAWMGQYDLYTPILSRNMCGFITSHSGLRSLAVLVSKSAVELVPHEAVPELSIFYGTPGGAAFILPGRPVHHLRLAGEEFDLNSENLSRMALTSVPLRILDLSAMHVPPSVLRDIATHLPTIEILSVSIRLEWTHSIVSRIYSAMVDHVWKRGIKFLNIQFFLGEPILFSLVQ